MRRLSERELLLLSNYLYIDECTRYRTINDLLDSCRDKDGNLSADRVGRLGIGGCMTAEEGLDLLREIDCSGPEFKALNVSRSIDEGGIRAICFAEDGDDANAAVVFRGTGGSYEAWADNVRGEYMQDTKMQKLADDFVRYDCGVYDQITVTGHSKGGNMAQYVTVTNEDRVISCVSFDGQGFGRAFFREYGSGINNTSGRIKSISAHNDYVNIILYPIAGERVYVKNIRNDMVGRHSSYALLKSCRFDENGNIENAGKQDVLTKAFSFDLAKMVRLLDCLPDDGNISISELIASGAAAVFSDEYDSEYENGRIMEALRGTGGYIAGVLGFETDRYEGVSVVTDSVYIDVNGLTQAVSQLNGLRREIAMISEDIAELRGRLNYKAATRLAVDTVLRKQENTLRREEDRLAVCAEALKEIAGLYAGCENGLTEHIRGTVL